MNKILLFAALLTVNTAQAQNPQMVYDLNPGPASSNPIYVTPFNGKLHFFAANSSTSGRLMWSYDGINPPTPVSNTVGAGIGAILYNQKMAVAGNKLYFAGNSTQAGAELFAYDGSNPPTLAADIDSGFAPSNPRYFATIGSDLYFRATTSSYGSELYRYDGVNPPVVIDLNPGLQSSNPAYLTEYNGKLYFSASTIQSGSELFVYDPVTDLSSIVQDINTGGAGSSPNHLLNAGGKLWFVAGSAATGLELHSYDGTTVTRLTDVGAGAISGASALGVIQYNGAIYFGGSTDGLSFQLYRYSPATGSASLVHTINAGATASPNAFVLFAGKLYFQATSVAGGPELWVTDGATTSQVADLVPGPSGSTPSDFAVWNGALYLNAENGTTGYELYRLTDPSGIVSTAFDGSVKLHPNPARDAVTLELSLPASQVLKVRLTDVQGREVWSQNAAEYKSGAAFISIPLHGLAAGSYFYHLIDPSNRVLATGKMIKE